jgi:hypothetical protein
MRGHLATSRRAAYCETGQTCEVRKPVPWLFPIKRGKSTSGSLNRSRPRRSLQAVNGIYALRWLIAIEDR